MLMLMSCQITDYFNIKACRWREGPEGGFEIKAVGQKQDRVHRPEEEKPRGHLLHDRPDQVHEGGQGTPRHHRDWDQGRDYQNDNRLQVFYVLS